MCRLEVLEGRLRGVNNKLGMNLQNGIGKMSKRSPKMYRSQMKKPGRCGRKVGKKRTKVRGLSSSFIIRSANTIHSLLEDGDI